MFSKFQNETEATKFDRRECAMIHLFEKIDGVVMSNHHTLGLCWRPGFLPVDSSAANNTVLRIIFSKFSKMTPRPKIVTI